MREMISYLGREIETTLRSFYALKRFREWVSKQDDVNRINRNPDFWRLYESSVRTNLFIGIRRLYEAKSGTFNFNGVVDACTSNMSEFSAESLRQRKLLSSPEAKEWIDDYMFRVYEPSVDDFKCLARLVRENSKKMKGPYTKAASTVYAHAVHMDDPTVAKLHSDLQFDEIEAALTSVWHCYRQLWELYENGRKPKLDKITKYPYEHEVYEALEKQLAGCA